MSRENVLLESLQRFYAENDQHLKQLTDVLDGSIHISLRVLDWLVTNYAKKHNIVYRLPDGTHFNVFMEYKAQLKAYSKRLFDPFCRRDRIAFKGSEGFKKEPDRTGKPEQHDDEEDNDDDECDQAPMINGEEEIFQTTVGQLNFFRWAILHGVLQYGLKHSSVIERDMLACISSRKLVCEKKRKELSKAAIRGVTQTALKVVVSFH